MPGARDFKLLLVTLGRCVAATTEVLMLVMRREDARARGQAPGPAAGGRAALPSVLALLLLAGDRLRLALAGAGVRVRALTANRQAAAMAQATIGAEIHQALDVHRHV